MLNTACSFIFSKFCNESDDIITNWMHIEERLKYAICQVACKSLSDPQSTKYRKPNLKEERRVLQNNYDQKRALINHIAKIRTLTQDVKMNHNVLPKDIRKSEDYSKFINNTKRYFHDMVLARCMATGHL